MTVQYLQTTWGWQFNYRRHWPVGWTWKCNESVWLVPGTCHAN